MWRLLLLVLDADMAAPHVPLLAPGSGCCLWLRVPAAVVRGHATTLAVAVAVLILQSLLATAVPHQVGHACRGRRVSSVSGVLNLLWQNRLIQYLPGVLVFH